MRVQYDNFRGLECKYLKYVSEEQYKFLRLYIIHYQTFKKEILIKYSESEIRKFFHIFPYQIYTVENGEDKYLFLKLEIMFYNELSFVQDGGIEYVLFDTSTELFEGMSFPEKIEQPISFEDFVNAAFEDFVKMHTGAFLFNIERNLREG